jgi:hypothetical protein
MHAKPAGSSLAPFMHAPISLKRARGSLSSPQLGPHLFFRSRDGKTSVGMSIPTLRAFCSRQGYPKRCVGLSGACLLAARGWGVQKCITSCLLAPSGDPAAGEAQTGHRRAFCIRQGYPKRCVGLAPPSQPLLFFAAFASSFAACAASFAACASSFAASDLLRSLCSPSQPLPPPSQHGLTHLLPLACMLSPLLQATRLCLSV